MGVHPDRHATGPARDVATQKFAEMKRIYDILMDPTQRQIYDAYGEKGVESGLNVGRLLKTPAEVRAEFLKQHYASQLQVSRLLASSIAFMIVSLLIPPPRFRG
jgi:curved DNA-binding protein CbpA